MVQSSGSATSYMSTVNATRQEMRKQAANIVGKIVVTGHESVQGSRRPMREDIYKKHISADKVPERLPYAIHRHTHAGAWSSCWQCLLSVSTYPCTYTVRTRSYGRATIPKHSCQLPYKPYLSHPGGGVGGPYFNSSLMGPKTLRPLYCCTA